MKTNAKRKPTTPAPKTAEGAAAYRISNLQALRRSVLSYLLWEDGFYEDGKSIAQRITELVPQCKPKDVADLAIEAREDYHLRHVPLFLTLKLVRHPKIKNYEGLVRDTLFRVIQRADEPAEFLAMYWADGRKTVPRQVRLGLSRALNKFSEYELAKNDHAGAKVSLKDVLFMTHAKPLVSTNENIPGKIVPAIRKKNGYSRGEVFRHEGALFEKLAKDELETPDTWETNLSAGKDKSETFTRLLKEGKLGYLALLRNLRNMERAGVDDKLIRNAILARKGAKNVLPFRYIAAAKAAPHFENVLDIALMTSFEQESPLPGKTIIVVDVSGSMQAPLSRKSELNRLDSACALAAVMRHSCDTARIYATAGSDFTRVHQTEEVTPRQGMALIDAIKQKAGELGGGGIFLTPCLRYIHAKEKSVDRIIVITDEQDCAIADKDSPKLAEPFGVFNYMLNVSAEKNGIGYGPKWTHLDGFSEASLRFIRAYEQNQD